MSYRFILTDAQFVGNLLRVVQQHLVSTSSRSASDWLVIARQLEAAARHARNLSKKLSSGN